MTYADYDRQQVIAYRIKPEMTEPTEPNDNMNDSLLQDLSLEERMILRYEFVVKALLNMHCEISQFSYSRIHDQAIKYSAIYVSTMSRDEVNEFVYELIEGARSAEREMAEEKKEIPEEKDDNPYPF